MNFNSLTQIKKFNAFGNFRFKEFENQEEFDAYILHPEYGISNDYAGVCFAFGIKKYAENHYELDLQFNDHMSS